MDAPAEVPAPSRPRDEPVLRRAPLAWLLPEERWVLATAVVVAALCVSTGTGFTVERVLDGYAELFGANVLIILIASRAMLWWRERRPRADAYYNRISLGHELQLLRTTAFLFAYITLYSNIKMRIPAFNPEIHDAALRAFETRLLLGVDLVEVARGLRDWPITAQTLDRVYHHDYIFMTLSALLLWMNAGPRHFRHLFTSMGVLYLMGVAITALWPTVGPCFTDREAYRWMHYYGIESWRTQETLLKYLLISRDAAEAAQPITARAFVGVAALPSLHVGHCFLLCVFAWHYHRKLLWVYVPVLALTWVATLVFGWHYLMDGVVAIPLVLLAVWISRRIVFGREAPGTVDPV
ncbi:MAG: phosphatase PAP2 family protein [Myxococcota bacterium]